MSHGGSVAIINHKSMYNTAISVLSFSSFEYICSVITLSSLSFKLFVVYRPSSSSIAYFCNEFESLIEFQISSNIDSFFIGDFNILIDNYKS